MRLRMIVLGMLFVSGCATQQVLKPKAEGARIVSRRPSRPEALPMPDGQSIIEEVSIDAPEEGPGFARGPVSIPAVLSQEEVALGVKGIRVSFPNDPTEVLLVANSFPFDGNDLEGILVSQAVQGWRLPTTEDGALLHQACQATSLEVLAPCTYGAWTETTQKMESIGLLVWVLLPKEPVVEPFYSKELRGVMLTRRR